MLARRERWTGHRAGVRKPPKNEPAGSGERLAVYSWLNVEAVLAGITGDAPNVDFG